MRFFELTADARRAFRCRDELKCRPRANNALEPVWSACWMLLIAIDDLRDVLVSELVKHETTDPRAFLQNSVCHVIDLDSCLR